MLRVVLPVAVIVAALFIVLWRWRVTVASSVRYGPGRMDVTVSVAGFFGRGRVFASLTGSPGDKVRLQASIFHVWRLEKFVPVADVPWRGLFADGGEGKSDGDTGFVTALLERAPLRRAFATGLSLLVRRLRVGPVRLHVRFGVGDAATTARLYGVFWAVVGVLLGAMRRTLTFTRPPDIVLQPVFNVWVLQFVADATVTWRQGDFVVALVHGVRTYRRARNRKNFPGEKGMHRL